VRTLFVSSLYIYLFPALFSPAVAVEAPANLRALPQTITANSVILWWEKPSRDDSIRYYNIYEKETLVGTTSRGSFKVENLSANQSYRFSVRSKDHRGDLSPACRSLRVKTKPQTVEINVVDFGATGDDSTLNTIAIQNAIDAAPAGGIVYIPPGIYKSGPLWLKSDMTLKLAKHAVLKAVQDIEAYYPLIETRYAGEEKKTFPALLNAGFISKDRQPTAVSQLTICGNGIIDAGGTKLGKAQWQSEGIWKRGRSLLIMCADQVCIEGLTFINAPNWNIHLIYSRGITVHGIKVDNFHVIKNADGIDFSSCENGYVLNSYFNTEDDCIVLKSGINAEGVNIGKPTRNIHISDCVTFHGHGGVVIGSDMSGGIEDIFIRDCSFHGTWKGIRIKSARQRGGYVRNIRVKNVSMSDIIYEAITINMDYSAYDSGDAAELPPVYQELYFENISCDGAQRAIFLQGLNDSYIENIHLKNVVITNSEKGVFAKFCRQISFINTVVNDNSGPFEIEQSENVNYD
jgi:polygalacturonase